jgi:hypothetical protein
MQVQARSPREPTPLTHYILQRDRAGGNGKGHGRVILDDNAQLMLARELPYQVHLGLPVRCSVGPQDLVEPY